MADKDLTSTERLALFEKLIDEGWSFSQIQQTHRVDHKTLKKYFPGRGWTLTEGAKLGASITHAFHNVNRT